MIFLNLTMCDFWYWIKAESAYQQVIDLSEISVCWTKNYADNFLRAAESGGDYCIILEIFSLSGGQMLLVTESESYLWPQKLQTHVQSL